jgi:hypothetical protein
MSACGQSGEQQKNITCTVGIEPMHETGNACASERDHNPQRIGVMNRKWRGAKRRDAKRRFPQLASAAETNASTPRHLVTSSPRHLVTSSPRHLVIQDVTHPGANRFTQARGCVTAKHYDA